MGRAAWCGAHFHGIVASLEGCRTRGLALLFGRRVPRGNFVASPLEIITNEHDTAVVILHLLVLIDIGNLIVRAEFDQLAAGPIAGSHVHTAVVENRRWNDCDSSWKSRLP